MSKLLSGCIVALLTLAACCSSDVIFFEFHPVAECRWAKGDTLSFILPPSYDDRDVDVSVEIRTNSRYPFQTLWLRTQDNLNNHKVFEKKQLKCKILNETGDIQGAGTSTISYEFPLGTYHVSKCHASTIKISHFMKSEFLEGIHDVGLKIEEK